MTKAEWHSIQGQYIREGTLVHSDGAAAYRSIGEGVRQDWVSHGSNTRKAAQYTKTAVHKRPSGNYRAVAGTQSHDPRRRTAHIRVSCESLVRFRRRRRCYAHALASIFVGFLVALSFQQASAFL
jgi:hypothetical protein